MKIITTCKQTKSEKVDNSEIKVGISACLLGHSVRYNGGHSRSRLCLEELSEHFSYRSFCPETAAGFGVPRPTLRLTGEISAPRLVFSNNQQQDVTEQLVNAINPVIGTLADLDGYILMKNSPSCGMERIKVYQDNGYPHTRRTQGLFTAALQKKHPNLPIEEEGRLNDARLKENFILRVFAHNHFRNQVDTQPTLGSLMNFHRDYKYVLMAHSQSEYKALGRLLAETKPHQNIDNLRDLYFQRFMQAISKPASRSNHCNVLLHILGYLKRSVDGEVRRDIADIIDRYRRGEVNLATPLTLIKHYVQRFGSHYVQTQRYLQPYPSVLGLSNQL
ncbi:DUF1722 domain-containing protein [Motiliproteus sp. MSK22-1]|uniref:YbgA family protein n=1 Tax=Motiliproteus sp. MSK22-1 TaxID=1897630 RepID=UPI000975DE7D|nr:DUF1722 domain-containing protein [Motiliproteus sp. MSK22-1]OMH38034.1 hypothetical protein BGP75_07050 [Motiliproteus sp. MSK22-1]